MFNRTRFVIANIKHVINLGSDVGDIDNAEQLVQALKKWNLALAEDYITLFPKSWTKGIEKSKRNTRLLNWIFTKTLELKPHGNLSAFLIRAKAGNEASLKLLDTMLRDVEELGALGAAKKYVEAQYASMEDMVKQGRALRLKIVEISKPMGQN